MKKKIELDKMVLKVIVLVFLGTIVFIPLLAGEGQQKVTIAQTGENGLENEPPVIKHENKGVPNESWFYELSVKLELTAEQTTKMANIFENFEKRTEADRKLHYYEVKALLKAAKKRDKEMTKKIKSILNRQQKKRYKIILKDRKKDKLFQELFELEEGLMLSSEQLSAIRDIVIDFRSRLNTRHNDGRSRLGFSPGMGGRGPGGSNGGMERNSDAGKMQGIIEEKDEAIEKLLSPHQKALYDQLKQKREDEKKARMEAMRRGGMGTPPHGGL